MSEGLANLGAMARLLVRGVRAGPPKGPPAAPRRRPAVERAAAVDAAHVAAYLRATDGTRIPAFLGEGAPAPPVFPATWEPGAFLRLFAGLDDPLPPGGVLHLSTGSVFLRPLHAGDRVRCRVELDRVERVERGLRFTVLTRNWNGAGVLCAESTAVLLVRARESAPAASTGDVRAGETAADDRRRSDGAPSPLADVGGIASTLPDGVDDGDGDAWEEVARWRLGAGEGRRYARASGDYNPIHLWGWSARLFGLRRPILHGYCTQARVAHAVIERRLGGDPGALRRLDIAFRAPVFLPSAVRLALAPRVGGGRFRVLAHDDARILAEGSWTGAA
jgi:acyl dehydratase